MARVTHPALAALVMVHCGECDVDFGMPQYLYEARKQDRLRWYCPLGHHRVFADTSERHQLQEQLANTHAALDAEREQRKAATAEALRLRKASVRARKRAAAGICPCCHRTVSQMARHMKSRHPEYAEATP